MAIKNNKQSIIKTLIVSLVFTLFSNNALKAQQTASDLQDVQQIVAIVNDELISLYDLKQRTLLLVLSGGSGQITQEQQQYLQNQAMSGLIDDKLKLQEAAKYEAGASEAEVENSYANYAKQFNMAPDELEVRLNESGVQKESLIQQLKSSMAWQRVMSGLLEPMVNVTDDEVDNFIEKLERDKGKFEYQVSEIFLLITNNEQREEIIAASKVMHDQLSAGADFVRMAQQFSQSSTASVGGDMGWIMENELPSEVSAEIPPLNRGDITEPIVTEDGVYILKLTNKRKILTLNDDDIAVDLKYLHFSKADFPENTIEKLKRDVLKAVQSPDACEVNDANGEKLNATDVGATGAIRVGDLPLEMRPLVLDLEVGYGTALNEEADGYRSFILCGKDIPVITLPDYEAVLQNITQTRLQLVARRHLRDLRRDAIVDYR